MHYEKVVMKKDEDLLELTSWGDIYSSCSNYEPPQELINLPPPPPPPPVLNFGMMNNSQRSHVLFPSQRIEETEGHENIQPGFSSFTDILIKQQQHPYSLDSLDLLKNYASGFTKLKGKNNQNDGNIKISAEEIVRIAGERFICFTTQGVDHTHIMHPYGSDFSDLSTEELRDVDLAHLLLAAADKVGCKQFERASKLLGQCESIATDTGNPVQRVVYYFAQALRERIGRETQKITSTRRIDDTTGMSTNLVFLKFNQEIPFNQVTVSTGVQAILENVENESEIHLIDLQIRSGVQWVAFMQTLTERVSCPVKYLKITAIGTIERQKMEETGKHLESLANSLNLSFSYNIIFLSDMKDLQQGHFQMNSQERPVIYCPLILRTMISRPDCLEHLIGVIKQLNPAMMVVTEVEANLNSPSFFNRFIETLFFYSAYFDCLEECTDRDNNYRNILERVFFGDGIYNIVGAEGEERCIRSVKMNVWDAFFKRFGIVQVELSESSVFLANLHLKQFPCASSCTLEKKGKSLLIGWKETPIQSISTWKFL